jgi:hypothetical protein
MDKIILTTPTSDWNAFAALQDGRGKSAKTTRALVAKIVVDQERMVRTLRAAGIKIEEA